DHPCNPAALPAELPQAFLTTNLPDNKKGRLSPAFSSDRRCDQKVLVLGDNWATPVEVVVDASLHSVKVVSIARCVGGER
ncbi:hypothetical protein ABK046_51575, partial [Streptomyces caeruleatus]